MGSDKCFVLPTGECVSPFECDHGPANPRAVELLMTLGDPRGVVRDADEGAPPAGGEDAHPGLTRDGLLADLAHVGIVPIEEDGPENRAWEVAAEPQPAICDSLREALLKFASLEANDVRREYAGTPAPTGGATYGITEADLRERIADAESGNVLSHDAVMRRAPTGERAGGAERVCRCGHEDHQHGITGTVVRGCFACACQEWSPPAAARVATPAREGDGR